ncbi:HTH_Tnp_Tc3_2 domain-containing protein [Trichonephila clavipes]|nr:HTH_Tnp_Tc3_2 domain-containing protein [Trichonephila clavipes]
MILTCLYRQNVAKFPLNRPYNTKQVPVPTPTMCLNEEIVRLNSHKQIEFERSCLVKSDGTTECRAGSQRLPITSSREDRHITRIALMDRAATPRVLSQELGSFVRQQVSARTVRRRLQQQGLSSQRSWLRLPLTLHHIQQCLQWGDQQ